MSTESTATYLYCVLRAKETPSAARAPRGLAGTGRVRLLGVDDGLWVVAADAPLARYGSEPIERGLRDLEWVSACAVAHDAVVEHFARTGTVIPMKLFTLFATDARAVEHIERSRKRLERLLHRLAGRQEWGVRVAVDERRALASRRDEVRRPTARASAGTGFLVRKKRVQDAARRLVEEGRAEADRVFDTLARRAEDARRQTPAEAGTGLRVLLDAAFLVPARRARTFRSAVQSAAARLGRRGYSLTLSGPWPPYTFVAEPA